MPNKICPLLLISRKLSVTMEKVFCKKDKCAWYVKHESPNLEDRAIRALAYVLKDIHVKI